MAAQGRCLPIRALPVGNNPFPQQNEVVRRLNAMNTTSKAFLALHQWECCSSDGRRNLFAPPAKTNKHLRWTLETESNGLIDSLNNSLFAETRIQHHQNTAAPWISSFCEWRLFRFLSVLPRCASRPQRTRTVSLWLIQTARHVPSDILPYTHSPRNDKCGAVLSPLKT